MKKTIAISLCSLLVLSSCGTSAGAGAYVGGQFGHVIGSAIGGITGGRHGHDLGSLIGTIGGAAAGAAIGAAVDNQREASSHRAETRRQIQTRQQDDSNGYSSEGDSGYDPQGRGDDRIDFGDAGGGSYSVGGGSRGYSLSPARTVEPTPEVVSSFDGYRLHLNPAIEIRNARVIDANEDGVLTRGESCSVVFEIMNNSNQTLYNIQPTVVDVTGNKHVHISPNLLVESIAPGRGVRYTATVLADRRLKDGTVNIRIAVAQNNREITSQIKEFTVPTRKKAGEASAVR